jgi:hypothetical protein
LAIIQRTTFGYIKICLFWAIAKAIWLTNKLLLSSILDKKKIALFALSNFLTIIGFVAAVFALKEMLNKEERLKFSRLKAIIGFWTIFLVLAIAFSIIAFAVNIALRQ